MLTSYEFGFYQPLYQMDELPEDICRKGSKAADKETQEEHQLLFANMALPPVYYFIVKSQNGMKDGTLPAPPYKGREIEDVRLYSLIFQSFDNFFFGRVASDDGTFLVD